MGSMRAYLCVVLAAVVAGCGGSVGSRYSVQTSQTFQEFSAPLDTDLYANVGDSIFVSGQIASIAALRMSGPISSSMPGALLFPFDFAISRTDLVLSFQTDQHHYYCGRFEDVDARHSMIGKVISRGDCVGVRISKSTGKKEWVVDNSNYNNQNTVWSRPVRDKDNVSFELVETMVPEGQHELTEIIFDGYFSDLLHFTYLEREGSSVSEKEFKFDVASNGELTRVGIRGYVFNVTEVSNVGMTYRWVIIPGK